MRKFFKILVITLLVLFVGLMILVVAFKVRNAVFLGQAEKEYVEYLNNNKKVFDGRSFFHDNARDFFGDETQPAIILLGESHGYAEVQDVDISLLFYLNRTKSVRYYLAEIDEVCAGMLNGFLEGEEKDTALLKGVIDRVGRSIPQQAGIELFDKWSEIYDYNKALPDSMRISVIGVDISAGISPDISRDAAMMASFVSQVKSRGLESESFYGLFGMFHVLQEGVNAENRLPFAALLKSAGYNVKSIVCMDLDSEVYMPENEHYPSPEGGRTRLMSMDGPLLLVKGINDLRQASRKNTITLFALDEDGSPYRSSQRLTWGRVNFFEQSFSPYDQNAATTDLVQYVVLLRNVGAVTPMD